MWAPPGLLSALTLSMLVAGLFAATTSAAAFGVYNPTWQGTSDLQSRATNAGAQTDVVLNTSAYPTEDHERTLVIVLTPDRPYNPRDIRRLRQFVADGGTLLVAEDFGPYWPC